MQPCPKMPRQPAKNGCCSPSRSTCWWSRNSTIACAVVSLFVFMSRLDVNCVARRKPNKKRMANIAICLIHQANYLIDQQLLRLEKDFLEQGGLRERMTRIRLQHRNNHPRK